MKRVFIFIALLCLNLCAHAEIDYCCPYYPKWFALFYLGKMTNNNLGQVMVFDFTLDSDTLYSIELGKELNPCNPFRQFFQPIVSTVDIRANVTLLTDPYGPIYELNPYFALNWSNFIWCQRLKTTISFGEGVSYASRIPVAEKENSDDPKRLLNFLLFEAAFALPCHPEWELVARIHHRSGAFGLYHANNSGSTAIGIALRYWF